MQGTQRLGFGAVGRFMGIERYISVLIMEFFKLELISVGQS